VIFLQELLQPLRFRGHSRILKRLSAANRDLQDQHSAGRKHAEHFRQRPAVVRNMLKHMRAPDQRFTLIRQFDIHQIHSPHGGIVKIDIQVLTGTGDQPRNQQRFRRHVQDSLVWRYFLAQQKKCRPMTLQRVAYWTLRIFSVRHPVAKRLESEAVPSAEWALSLLPEQTGQATHSP
jgi:hypothetical protein